MKSNAWFALGLMGVVAACKPTPNDEPSEDGGNGGEATSGKAGRGGSSGKGGRAGSTSSGGDAGAAEFGGKGGSSGKGSGGKGGSSGKGTIDDGGESGSGGKGGSGGSGGSGTGGYVSDAGEGGDAGAESGGSAGEGAGGTAGAAAGSGGTAGDGSHEVEEGDPGSVGNRCTVEGACDTDLVCADSFYCQPQFTNLPYQIVQAVPTPDSSNIPSSAPLLLFADAAYSGVTFTVAAYLPSGVTDITTAVAVIKLTSGAAKDIYVLAPKGGFPLGASIVVTIGGPFEGTAVFNVDHASPPFADGELSFEGAPNASATCESSVATALPAGWTGFGDVGSVPATGTVLPTEGDHALALTSGALLCGQALADTSSMVVSGPIRGFGDEPTFAFDYNFQSSEFDDYCASEFDDSFLAVLAGPNGAVATLVDSVNLVCERTRGTGVFPGTPDGGDADYKETGNTVFSLHGAVGSPAVLSFIVTDVSDATLSTLVSVDAIRAAD